jgi:hypothetical protein
MKSFHRLVIALALCGTAAAARADEGEADVALERGAGLVEDANLDHAWFMPTGITQPRGAWKVSDTELLILGLSYGITDDLGVTVGGMVPLTDTTPVWASAKLRFLHVGRLHVAAQAGAIVAHTAAREDDVDQPVDASNSVMPTAALAASVCLDAACRSLIGGYGGAAFDVDDGHAFGLVGLSAIVHVVGPLKLMIEADQGNQLDWPEDDGGFLVWYGIRLASPSFAVDLGALSGVAGLSVDDGEVGVALLPWFKIAYRAL